MKKRVEYLDIAKGIGAVLVLLGHLQGEFFLNLSPYVINMCEWIFSFHMPLFFIISGILISLRGDTEKDFRELAKKRFNGIMIPYFWFSFFYMLVVVRALVFGSILPDTLYVNLWYVLSMYGMNVLWFLPALFFSEILFFFIVKKVNKKILMPIIIVTGILGMGLSYLFSVTDFNTKPLERLHEFLCVLVRPMVGVTFIYIGYLSAEFKSFCFGIFDPLKKNEGIKKAVPVLLIGLVLMILGGRFVYINHGVDFRSLAFKNVFFYYLCSLLGSYGLITLCKGIDGLSRIQLLMTPFKFFGINSLIFMATHNSETVLYYGMQLAMTVNQYITRARGYISYLTVVLVILAYVTVMTILINKFFPFIVGKKRRLK